MTIYISHDAPHTPRGADEIIAGILECAAREAELSTYGNAFIAAAIRRLGQEQK